jgi:TPR repeat protein
VNLTVAFTTGPGPSRIAQSKWFAELKTEAESGNPTAQYMYAVALSGDPESHQSWGDVLPWIEKSAQSGFSLAQYQLGESLLAGRGCTADAQKAMQWLQRAAQQDFPDAQTSLARLLLKAGPGYDAQKALLWLSRASGQGDARANRYLAALLASSSDEHIRDAARALELVGKMAKAALQEPTVIEIRAAALAGTGDYGSAVESQSRAIKRAESLHWDVSAMKVRLAAYEHSQPWFGELMEF